MDEKAIKPKSGSSIPESAFNSPITELEIPTSVHKLLEGSGYVNVGDIMLQVAEDEKQILAVRGIGPKILEQIIFAIKEFEFPEDNSIQIEHPKYNSPVPSLADYFKPPPGNNVESSDEDIKKDIEGKAPSYNPPVPSLADYFDPNSVITSVNPINENSLKQVRKEKPPKKKKVKAKKKPKKEKKIPKEKKKTKKRSVPSNNVKS